MTGEDQRDARPDGRGAAIALAFRRAVVLGAAGAAILAVVAPLGALPELSVVRSLPARHVPMAPLTAVCFLILAGVVFRHDRSSQKGPERMTALALVMMVSVVGAMVLVWSAAGLGPLLAGPAASRGVFGALSPDRMSPLTGASFGVAGLGTFLLRLRSRSARHARLLGLWASRLGILALAAGVTVLLAYLYGKPFLDVPTHVPMASSTAAGFVLLGLSLAAAAGPASLPYGIAGDSTAARLARAFVPLALTAAVLQSVLSRFASSTVHDALLLAVVVTFVAAVTASVVSRAAQSIGHDLDVARSRLRRSGKRLRRSEAMLQGITDAMPEPVFLKDREGRWRFANPAALAALGKSSNQVLGKTDLEIQADPANGRALMEIDERVMASGVPETFEETVQTPDGERQFLASKAPVRDREGRAIGVVGSARDITERARVEGEDRGGWRRSSWTRRMPSSPRTSTASSRVGILEPRRSSATRPKRSWADRSQY